MTTKAAAHFVDGDLATGSGLWEQGATFVRNATFPYIIIPSSEDAVVIKKSDYTVERTHVQSGAQNCYSASIAPGGQRYAIAWQKTGSFDWIQIFSVGGTDQNITFEDFPSGIGGVPCDNIQFSEDGVYIYCGGCTGNYTHSPDSWVGKWNSTTGELVDYWVGDTNLAYLLDVCFDTVNDVILLPKCGANGEYGLRTFDGNLSGVSTALPNLSTSRGKRRNSYFMVDPNVFILLTQRDSNNNETSVHFIRSPDAETVSVSDWTAWCASSYGATAYIVGMTSDETQFELRKYTVTPSPLSIELIKTVYPAPGGAGDAVDSPPTGIAVDEDENVTIFFPTGGWNNDAIKYDSTLTSTTLYPTIENLSGDNVQNGFGALSYGDKVADYSSGGGDPLSYQARTVAYPQDYAHLEDEVVQVLADGVYLDDNTYTISGGAVTPSYTATIDHVGLQVVSKLQPMKIDGEVEVKRIAKIIPDVFETVGGKYGESLDDLYTMQIRTSSPLEQDSALYSGYAELPFKGSYNRQGDIVIQQDIPLPFILLGIGVHLSKEMVR